MDVFVSLRRFPMPTSRLKTALPVLAMTYLALVWGINWPVMKLCLQDAGPFTFSAWRSFLGAVALFAVMIATRRSLKLQRPGATLILGLTQTTGFMACSGLALVTGGAGKVAVLVYSMPVFTLFFAWWMLGERIRGAQWLAIVAAFTGLVLIISPWQMHGTIVSSLFALACGVIWGFSVVWGKKIQAQGEVDVLSLTAWQMLLGSLFMILIAWRAAEPLIHWTPFFAGALFFNVVPCNSIAWLVWLYLLRTMRAGTVALGSLSVPVVGVLGAAMYMGEVPGRVDLAGMVCILGGLALLGMLALRTPPAAQAD